MTALDQAFIKAYVQQGGAPGPAVVPSARPVLLSDVLAEHAGPPGVRSPEGRRLAVTRALERPRAKQEAARLPDAAALEALVHCAPAPVRAPGTPATAGDGSAQAAGRARGSNGPARAGQAKVCVADLGIPREVCCLESPGPTLPLREPLPRLEARLRPERPPPSPPVLAAVPASAPPAPVAEATGALTADSGPGPEPGVETPEAPPAPFRPLMQVDRFGWPEVCCALEARAEPAIDRLADALWRFAGEGKNVLALAARRRGEGSTTLLMCAARRLAARGLRVVLADGDEREPALAGRLDLVPEAGWEAAAAGRLALEEVVIESVADRLALLPRCRDRGGFQPAGLDGPGGPSYAGRGAGFQPANNGGPPTPGPSALDTLRKHYDLVLVDLGPLEEAAPWESPSRAEHAIDGLLLVRNVRATSPSELDEARRRLDAAGISLLGVAENCV